MPSSRPTAIRVWPAKLGKEGSAVPEFKPPREGELSIDLPPATDAGLMFIGEIRTPWPTPADCPKNSILRAEVEAQIILDEKFRAGLKDIENFDRLVALYWLDRSRRDLIVQAPGHLLQPRGVFALRSPVRPNPIGFAVVELLNVDGGVLTVRNIDCADRTPLIDLKPYFTTTDSFPDPPRKG